MFKLKQKGWGKAALSAVMLGLFVMVLPAERVLAAEGHADAAKAAKKEMRESRKQIRKVMKAARDKSHQAIRGAQVYETYCVLCHGAKADGENALSKVPGDLPMQITKQSAEFYEKIVTGGGPAVGKSKYMPAWADQLSEEQTKDLVMYLAMVTDPVHRGEIVFKTNCILCHGVNGDGMGRASVLFDPPPANLTRSDKTDAYKKLIITKGGEYMGRSPVMPIWGQELNDSQIDDVVQYLRTILVVPWPGE